MKLTHPKTGQTIDVGASTARVYETQGWERTPDPVKPVRASARAVQPAVAGTENKEQTNG